MAKQENNDKIKSVFSITAFFDKARWPKPPWAPLNFHTENLSPDQKLLTHWLCFITDRQTPVRRIWGVGAFIFSQIAQNINNKDALSLLDPANHDSAYFIKRQDYPHVKEFRSKAIKRPGDEGKYLFTSRIEAGEDQRLHDYDFKGNVLPYFIPRYYPADYKAILSTYVVLEKYQYSLAQYLKERLNILVQGNVDELVPKLLFSLYLLTYHEIGRASVDGINFERFLQDAEKRTDQLTDLFDRRREFDRRFQSFQGSDRYYNKLKRPWCALRDWFKYPPTKEYFEQALEAVGFEHLDFLRHNREAALSSFELPGDTWNNNPKFRGCVLRNTQYADGKNRKKESFGKVLREICNENEGLESRYPEQFDITFDFVPRMCTRNNCGICPYGRLNGKGTDFELVCRASEGGYCPVALGCCGYRHECPGREECDLLDTLGL